MNLITEKIIKEIKDELESSLESKFYCDIDEIKYKLESFIGNLLKPCVESYRVSTKVAIDYIPYIECGEIKLYYVIEDGSLQTANEIYVDEEGELIQIHKVFPNTESAKLYGMNTYKQMIFNFVTFCPIKPAEYITMEIKL